MELRLYSVYDKTAKIYHPPHYCHNAGHAIRMFTQIFNKAGSVFQEFPHDFQVWELGVFDDQTAKIEVYQNPTLITGANTLVKGEQEQQPGE